MLQILSFGKLAKILQNKKAGHKDQLALMRV